MFFEEKRDIISSGIKMDRYGLIALSGGNLGLRTATGEILITPSGIIYEEMKPDDILVMDIEGSIISGDKKPSSDTAAILYIFKHRPDLNAVIHTHQPYATAVGLIQDELEVCLTTLANATRGSVKVCSYSSAGSVDMGIDTVNNLGDSLAVILAHHGVMTVGKDLNQALYAAVYLEEASKCYLSAKAVGTPKKMNSEQISQAIEIFNYYGQGTDQIPEHLLKRV